MKSYGISTLCAASVLVVAMGGCREAALDEDAAAVPIGLLADVDENGDVLQSYVEAARLAVERVNGSGGVLLGGRRRRVELQVAPASDARTALAGALELVNRRRVVAVVGPYDLASALPVATLAEASGVPMMLPAETVAGPTVNRSFVFRATPRDTEQGLSLARFATEELAGTRIAAVYDPSSPGSAAVAKSFRVGATGFEGTMTGIELGDETLGRLRDARPDVVLLLVEGEPAVRLVREARRAGVVAEMIGLDMHGELALGELGPMSVAVSWSHVVPTEVSRTFVETFRARLATAPRTNDALTFDAVGLVLAAMARAGTDEREAIRRGLREMTDYPGVSGVISYDGSAYPKKPLALIEARDGEVRFRRWLPLFGS